MQKRIFNLVSIFGLVYTISCLSSCFPPDDQAKLNTSYSLKDPEIRQILDASDRRQTDTVLSYFQHEKASLRYVAALSFASNRDSTAISALIQLLKDPVEKVKQAAVFALGQIGNQKAETALIQSFIAIDSTGPYVLTNAMILEALGKCGGDSTLQLICNISSYTPADSLLVYGQIAALYRFGLREKYCKASEEKFIRVATDNQYPENTRLLAAHGLQRFKAFKLNDYFERLKIACREEKNADIRMCLVSALSRIPGPSTISTLEELYSRGLDIRIQSNIVKGLLNQQGLAAQFFALKAIQNPSLQVSVEAAQYLKEKGSSEISEELKKLCEQTNLPWQVRSLVFEAALKYIPSYLVLTKQSIEWSLKTSINQSKNPYEKAAYVKAISWLPKELPFIISLDHSNAPAYLRTTITECIEKILKSSDFTQTYKGSFNPIYYTLSSYFTKQCTEGDPGVLAIMASIFSKPVPLSKKFFYADSMLQIAQSKLKLPKDIETYNELEKCLSTLRKTTYIGKHPEFNHPVNWTVLDNYQDTIKALILTNKGKLNIEIYPKEAPASVINFLNLVRDSFYNEKIFHRVVPNFVVQIGCPRGDGFGALDYSIRTEISYLNYQSSGMIGMASAGPDTEGTQFFITHSPTPHLDGRYTVFGKLINGQEVLMSISQSDIIKSIQIQ